MAEETPNTQQEAGEAKPAAESVRQAKLPEGVQFIWGTGRRKKSVARIRIKPGTGKFIVNKRDVDEFFNHDRDRNAVRTPLTSTNMAGAWDVFANVNGGGFTGQAGAVVLGLSRALRRAMPEVDHVLRSHGLLTRDARMKERKKYGQKGARKRFQFSKR
jgi:small subunit ribosomal protein S9